MVVRQGPVANIIFSVCWSYYKQWKDTKVIWSLKRDIIILCVQEKNTFFWGFGGSIAVVFLHFMKQKTVCFSASAEFKSNQSSSCCLFHSQEKICKLTFQCYHSLSSWASACFCPFMSLSQCPLWVCLCSHHNHVLFTLFSQHSLPANIPWCFQ